ncbi:MAG TPA: hemolysin family protein [Gemmatimonadaceae bacterium]|nr:hemolysin family protein [Gemmatimonadaceae bacterium]
MTMVVLWIWIVAALALVGATVCAMADSALLAVHASGTATVSDAGLADRERTHRALSMGRVLSYIAAGASIAQTLSFDEIAVVPRALVTALVAIVACTIAEGFGRSIGYANPPAVHAGLATFARIVAVVLRPAVALGGAIDRTLHAIIPPTARDPEEREASAEQFREVVTAEADVSSAEEELIHGVFSLGETEVQEIMVPRVDILGIEVATPWSEVLDRIRSSEHARLPVFRETLDEVVGILYAKDVLPSIVTDVEPAAGWPSLVRPSSFIPTSKRIDAQLREFQASRTHIAIVSDEYGGTAGLVTIEDILEEIVGEIRDEHDVEEPSFQQEGFGRYWVSGRMPVDELSERLNANLAIDDVTTVGGLVYALFGRVPKSGESHVHAGFRIVVERVRRRRIERVYFERLEPVASAGGQ